MKPSVDSIKAEIQALVDLETEGWNAKNADLFLSMIHPDMIWPWPPTADDHDPVTWMFVQGRFDCERWRKNWQNLFDTHDLVHNHRRTVKIELSEEGDAALPSSISTRSGGTGKPCRTTAGKAASARCT